MVLVVEDNPEMNRFISQSLSGEYNIVTAFDGQEGLEKAIATPPALIVTDIMMPRVSGVQMIADIRKCLELADVPILLLTAKADEDLKIKLLENGAQDFVAKPFSEKDLQVRVRNLIHFKQSQEKLKQANDELIAASRSKDDFLAALSHELRTPLNPVLLIASDSAHNPDLPTEIRSQFEVILKNVEVEAALIDDLLNLSHINHGKLNLKIQTVDAHTVLREAIQIMQSQIEVKRTRVIVHLNAEQHFISADSVRLQQIFWNILKNAAKFTPKDGTITIETFSTGEGGRFSVKISDTGIGMTPDELERVFSPFAQGDHVKSANFGVWD